MFRKILVALDGSEASRKATEWALNAYAESPKAEFTLMYAHPVPVRMVAYEPYGAGFGYVTSPQDAEVPLENPASASYALFPDKERVSQIAVIGHAAEVILEEAGKGGYDLIVLGSEGHGVVESVLLGSVSSKVLHHAKCSVLIVR
ncbi:universal stress protein [Tumebacillus flagellatus]|uniref:UspA domain-containing protein n=1 Tax=Tumebacillus flagellatus TaxID=1157490 RepID=A0A074LSW7_9BACL|nr:universal stress protein [Tumebacillus flagellatus]KEO85261.1 hypothetical protein EL26_01500 [Tumebacillus flagellatus]